MSKYRKSAQQLADVVPYVALLIVGGHVNVLFPATRPSRYSEFVVLTPSKGPYPSVVPEGLSLFFDGRQGTTLLFLYFKRFRPPVGEETFRVWPVKP